MARKIYTGYNDTPLKGTVMKKLSFAYHTAMAAITVVSYVYCVGVIGRLASDLCAEAGKKYLETNYHKK